MVLVIYLYLVKSCEYLVLILYLFTKRSIESDLGGL